jgi:hypothetical protein
MAYFPGTVVVYEALHVHLDLHVYLLVTASSVRVIRKMVTTVIASAAQER